MLDIKKEPLVNMIPKEGNVFCFSLFITEREYSPTHCILSRTS